MKHYNFVFSNNNGDTVATMTLATPMKIDVFELGDDLAMSLKIGRASCRERV